MALLPFTVKAIAQDATTAGKPVSEHPTYENLSIDWPIQGDQNENGDVKVRFRQQGTAHWNEALPLFRVPAGSNCGFQWRNRHSGSLFNLTPDTTYEIELSLRDPDGGDQTQTLTASTRAWPKIANTGQHVDPKSIAAALSDLKPGTVIVLGDGEYGDIKLPRGGTEENPVVLRAKNRHLAVVNGDVRMDGKSHIQIVGLKVNGKIKFNNATDIVVHQCDIQTEDDGIVAYGPDTQRITVTDNVLNGSSVWREESLGTDGDNRGEGIVLTGAGHVIANNYVEGFRDGISLVEDKNAHNQRSIDIYGNDIYKCCDDGIEADFAMGNVRVYKNRLTDCFMGISSQPSLGGPTYFIRNVLYNALLQGFKLQRSSVGDIGFHNSVIKSGDAFSVNTEDVWSRAWFCNNLFIGSAGRRYNSYHSGNGKLLYIPSAAPSCKFEHNGFGSIGTDRIEAVIGEKRLSTAEEIMKQNNLLIDINVFAAPILIPHSPTPHEPPSFSLAEKGQAIDQGRFLPNINDQFEGEGPDLGAIELGDEPSYGPRYLRSDPEQRD